MPRSPDPALEERVVAAALRLLDRGGEQTVTLRAVAKEAGTTTPSIYERFQDRKALMQSVLDRATEEVLTALQPAPSIEAMFREYLRHSKMHPMRLSLTVETFGARFVAGDKMPVFELLVSRISERSGTKGRECEDLALAIASLGFGTAQGMIAAGSDSGHGAQLQRTSLRALRMLLAAFPAKNKRQATTRRETAKTRTTR